MSWATVIAMVVAGAISWVYEWLHHQFSPTRLSLLHLPGKRSLDPEAACKKLFETILDEFARSRCFSFPSDISPNIFVVYAHNNEKEGAAHEGSVRQLITWLGRTHAQALSDQFPLPLFTPRVEGIGAIGNIVANQMCLLPPSRGDTPVRSSVDKIIMCGSEVLEAYCHKPYAPAYIEDIARICTQYVGTPTETDLESIIRERVEKECKTNDFHHVLTELAFVEARVRGSSETKDLVPVVLNQIDPDEPLMQYLPCFQGTDVKLKLKSNEPSSVRTLFFKLLKRLYPEHKDFIRPFENFYLSAIKTPELHSTGSGRMIEKEFTNIINQGIEQAHEEYREACGVFAGNSILQNYTAKLSDKTSRILEHVGTIRHSEILDWLSTVPTSEIHGKYHDSGTQRIEGTCDWVVEDAKFRQWHESEKSACLWLNGDMGTGKSYCTSRVIDWVRSGLEASDNDEAFAYFYCNKQDRDRSQAKGILRNIIRQLASGPFKTRSSNTAVEKTVHELWKKHKTEGIGSTFAEWEQCLVALIEAYPRTTIVLDALDECGCDDSSQRQEMINFLVNLVSRYPGARPVKLFVSGRPQDDLRRHLDRYPTIRMQEKHNANDIASFVRLKISEHLPWSELPRQFQNEMIHEILTMSSDMFLLAALQVQQLRKYTLQSVLKSHLKKLPDSLNSIYGEIYREAKSDPDERKVLNKALRWVLCAATPLTTEELLFAISQEFESDSIERQNQDLNEALIRRWTHNFLSLEDTPGNGYSRQPGVWRLAHQAVAEFLQESSDCTLGLAHCEAGKLCLLLLIDNFGSNRPGSEFEVTPNKAFCKDWDLMCPCRPEEPGIHLRLPGTLAEYAAYAWPTHIRAQDDCKAPGVDDLSYTLQAFLGQPQKGSPAYQRWIHHASRTPWNVPGWSTLRFRRMLSNNHCDTAMTPIVFATHLGIYTCLSDWWASPEIDYNLAHHLGQDVWWPSDSSIVGFSGQFFSLFSLVCAYNEVIVKHILERNVQVNTTTTEDVPPIVAAVVGGWVGLVELLIKRGADICSPFTSLHGHILLFAIRSNSIQVLEFLMQQSGLSQAQEIESILTSVHFEDFQSAQAIEALLGKGVNVNTPLKVGTLVLAAASNGWQQMVDCLIKKGAALNTGAHFRKYDSILHALISSRGHASPEMIALFVDDGAQVNSRVLIQAWRWADPVGTRWDTSGNRIEKRKELLLMLLEHVPGLDETWHDFDQYGGQISALIEAVAMGQLELVRLLCKHGANVNLRVGNRNALESVFHMILSRQEMGSSGRFYAERKMINLLVKEGGILDNLEGDRLNNALAAAAYAGWEDLVERFLHRGASPYERLARRPLGLNTALGVAVASKHSRVPLIIHTLLNNDNSLKDKYKYYVAARSVLDRIFREVLSDSMLQYSETGRLLETAIVLAQNHAVWDRDFTQWVELLRSKNPHVWEQNTQALSELEEKLAQNKARLFEKFPYAGSLEEWRAKRRIFSWSGTNEIAREKMY